MKLLVASLAFTALPWANLHAQSGPLREARWYVVTSSIDSLGASLSLSPKPTELALSNGWLCSVTPGTVTDSRRTSCHKGSERLTFVVACDADAPRQHTQLQLRSETGNDFIEVGCELPRDGESLGHMYSLYRSSVANDSLRIHVATFDAAQPEAYNRENCDLARQLFSTQPGVRTTWWCERGPPRRR